MRRAFERAYKIYYKNFKLSSLKNQTKIKNREIFFKKSEKRAFEHAYKIFHIFIIFLSSFLKN